MKVILSKEEWCQFRKPCVYKFIDGLGNPIYIGFGRHGYDRVFNGPSQKHLNRETAKDVCSSVQVEFFDTHQEANDAENLEIHKYHPIYNKCCTLCAVYDKIKKSGEPITRTVISKAKKAPKPAKWFLLKYPNGMTNLKPSSQ
jgi:excinuclease UvrABC nuclease subunit